MGHHPPILNKQSRPLDRNKKKRDDKRSQKTVAGRAAVQISATVSVKRAQIAERVARYVAEEEKRKEPGSAAASGMLITEDKSKRQLRKEAAAALNTAVAAQMATD